MVTKLLNQTLAVAQRILLEQWRQGRGLIFWALFPAPMMLLFGLVYANNDSMRRAGCHSRRRADGCGAFL